MNIRPIVTLVGLLLSALGALMLIPAAVDLSVGDAPARRDAEAFLVSSGFALFTGVSLAIATRGPVGRITARQGFLVIASAWVSLVSMAAVPFAVGPMDMSYTDAFFEAMSGLTTTGATVVTGLDDAPRGFLIWRALLQWIGGVGVVIMAISVMPFLSVGGMQLFKLESSDASEQLLPRASQIAGEIFRIYLFFTILCILAYRIGGMDGFDAFAHAMTTIATGGFSTHDASFAHFASDQPNLLVIAITFMALGGLPFGLYMMLARGRTRAARRDPQVRFFVLALAGATLLMAPAARAAGLAPGEAGLAALFNVVSIVTGTGYASTDYGAWGPLAVSGFFCLTFMGACAGSTSCGMKIFRLQIAFAAIRLYARRLTHPHAVSTAIYNGRPVSEADFSSVLSFIFVYFAVFATLAALFGALGLDPTTALSSAATSVANVGPGLGDVVGPAGNFQTLSDVPWRSDAAKWIFSAGMLLGRLEFFTILVLLTPDFWRR